MKIFDNKVFQNNKKKKLLIYISISIIILFLIILIIVLSTSSKSKKDSQTPFERYLNTPKALYAWQYYRTQYFLDFLTTQKFKRVYINVGKIYDSYEDYFSKGEWKYKEFNEDHLEDLVKKLNDLNIEVELVSFLERDQEDFTDWERILDLAKMVKKLNETHKIKALHIDQEPEDIKSFENLLWMYRKLSEIVKVSGVIMHSWINNKLKDVPFKNVTFKNEFNDCENVYEAIIKVCDYTDLMAYNKEYNTTHSYMEEYAHISKKFGKEYTNLIHVAPEEGSTEKLSILKTYKENKNKFFDFIADMGEKYGMIGFHPYYSWYEALYCDPYPQEPFHSGKPLECP